ncbi:MAG: hypothetical protein M5T61_09645 [Acidimicrobiia bacterium]|nr:hypothetical protein [Acidimicrobiia bacterium]
MELIEAQAAVTRLGQPLQWPDHLRRPSLAYDGTDPGPCLEQTLGFQEAHAFSQSRSTDAHLLGEDEFRRQSISGTELSAQDQIPDLVDDLIRSSPLRTKHEWVGFAIHVTPLPPMIPGISHDAKSEPGGLASIHSEHGAGHE